MTTATLTLSDFLLARIAEDEAMAAAVDLSPDTRGIYQRRRADGLYDVYTPEAAEFYVMRVLTASEDGYPTNAQDSAATSHFAHFDPARVLAECEAKRRIVEEHAVREPDVGRRICDVCWSGSFVGHEDYPCPTLRALAGVYADHDDYRSEWAV